MRICVFGAGALGSAIGGLLAAKNDLSLVGRKPHVKEIGRNGLSLIGDIRRHVELPAFESIESVDGCDLLLITTKAYDTAAAVEECKGWTGPKTRVLTLQNGLGNLELLRAWKGRFAFGGTTTMGATLVAPGKVRLSGFGRTVIGGDEDRSGAKEISSVFTASGIPASVTRDIRSEVWSKAAVSSCINPLTAILRIRNGRLLESPWTQRLFAEIINECETVARAEGVHLSRTRLVSRVRAVARDTHDNRSSMLQDVLIGKKTEIGQINGAFSRLGRAHGIETPLNAMLTATVESLVGLTIRQKG